MWGLVRELWADIREHWRDWRAWPRLLAGWLGVAVAVALTWLIVKTAFWAMRKLAHAVGPSIAVQDVWVGAALLVGGLSWIGVKVWERVKGGKSALERGRGGHGEEGG